MYTELELCSFISYLSSQRDFIHYALRFYQLKRYQGSFPMKPKNDIIEWLYKLGVDYQLLSLDYEQFKEIIFSGYYQEDDSSYQSRWEVYEKERHGDFRQGKKYVKKPHHCKKEKKDNLWREQHFLKDKQKRRSWRRPNIYFDEGSYRAWVKNVMCHERYDELSNKGEERDFVNNWH